MNYHVYLLSTVWRELKNKALQSANHRCQTCNSPLNLNVHHRKYPKTLGTEPVSDLVVLCRACHKTFHRLNTLSEIKQYRVGKIRNTKRKYHYWVKDTDPTMVKSLCNPGLRHSVDSLVPKCDTDTLCLVCRNHEWKIALRPTALD